MSRLFSDYFFACVDKSNDDFQETDYT